MDGTNENQVSVGALPDHVIAWTGGSSPPKVLPRLVQRFADDLLARELAVWQTYWNEEIDDEVRATFANRARHDAWATLRDTLLVFELDTGFGRTPAMVSASMAATLGYAKEQLRPRRERGMAMQTFIRAMHTVWIDDPVVDNGATCDDGSEAA